MVFHAAEKPTKSNERGNFLKIRPKTTKEVVTMNSLRKRFLMTLSTLTILLGSEIVLFGQNVVTAADFEAGSRQK